MRAIAVNVLSHGREINPQDDNVDVEITLDDGRIYSATFFTLKNLKAIIDAHKISGESAGGSYVWAADMIVVEEITREVIFKSIEDLIQHGSISTACSQIGFVEKI